MQELGNNTHHAAGVSQEAMDLAQQVRGNINELNENSKSLRESVETQQNCRNDQTCMSLRAAYASMDGTTLLTEKISELAPDMSNIDAVTPQLLAMMPPRSVRCAACRP